MDTLELPRIDAGGSAVGAGSGPSRRRRGSRPLHRPPLALRAVIGLLGVGALLATAALMLSDRAPRLLRSMFGDAAERLSARLDASGPMPSTSQLPESDFIVHVGLWTGVALLVAWALWTWRGLLVGAVAVYATSLVIEAAQGVYSDTRHVEAHDALANAVGVAAGTALAGLCYLLWSGFATAVDGLRRR